MPIRSYLWNLTPGAVPKTGKAILFKNLIYRFT